MSETIDAYELQMLLNNKESGYNYRERRHEDWDENYLLGRDKVITNRLTQRQSVNLPLMKLTQKTLMKDMDDMPNLYFENLDNDEEAEMLINEYWKDILDKNKSELQDIVDKKQEFYFGRTFDQWQIIDGHIVQTIQDPMDILVSRFMNPFDLHSSEFLIHMHIYDTLSSLKDNPDNDKEAIKKLEEFYKTEAGVIKAGENLQSLEAKNQKLAEMGVTDIDDPLVGETYVEKTLHFVFRSGEKDSEGKEMERQIFLYVEVDDMVILSKKPLVDVIDPNGYCKEFWKKHYPYSTWAGDVERQDFWSDGGADTVRTPNKVLNSWFSQEVERRTMSNFGMHYFDSTIEGFNPTTLQPVPWGWYGVPGKPSEVLQKVDIPANDGNLESMNFLIAMIEKATGATATQQGAQTERQVTLGEVQLALGEAKERIKGMSKFYTQAWKDRGELFLMLLQAGQDDLEIVKLYKKGKNTNRIYGREVEPKRMISKSGYRCRIWSLDEKNARDMESLQKIDAVSRSMPDNPKLTEIKQRKMLEFAGLLPDEINEVMQFEEQKREALVSMIGQGVQMPGMPLPAEQPAMNAQPQQPLLPA